MYISQTDYGNRPEETFLKTNGDINIQASLVQLLIDLGYIVRHTAKVSNPQAGQPKWLAYLLHNCDKKSEITIADPIYRCINCGWKGYNVLSNGKTVCFSFSRRSDGVQLELKIHSVVLSKNKATLYLYFSRENKFNYRQIAHLRKHANRYKEIENRLMKIDDFYRKITIKDIPPDKMRSNHPHIILFLV